MAVSFLSLRGNGGPPLGNPPHGAASNGNNLHSGKGFKLSGSKMVKNEMKLRVAAPFTSDNKVNPIPMLSKVLETALLLDPTSCLKALKPSMTLLQQLMRFKKMTKSLHMHSTSNVWLPRKSLKANIIIRAYGSKALSSLMRDFQCPWWSPSGFETVLSLT